MDQLQLLPEFISNHLFLVGAFVVVLALLIKAEYDSQTSRGFQLDAASAIREMNNEDARILDLRTDAEFAKMHIKGAKQVAESALIDKVEKLGINKTDTILVYCNHGNTSARACRKLIKEGYTNVKNLKGGLTAWQEANLPVTTK